MTYQFDTFEVDDREFRLLESGAPVQVEPKVLRLLLYLIENRNRLVRKQELLDKVWQDAMVTENALTRVIGLLRKALNDDTHVPRFIETVPTAGYRFIAKVTVVEESPAIEPMTPAATTAPAAEPGRGFRAKKWILASVVALLAVVVVAYFFAGHRRRVLTEKDTVVLADFDNSTDDPVFDGTLRQGMSVQLEQSPFLSLISDQRIQQTLRVMGQPADARLTPAVAREICERTASAAVLNGSIASLGSQYVLGLRAVDCRNGKVLDAEQAQVARKEDVLNALSQIASRFRTRVGESLTTVEKYDTPLVDATTPSLEALKAYSLAVGRRFATGGNIALSALLHAGGRTRSELRDGLRVPVDRVRQPREPELAAENIRKAYELRDEGERAGALLHRVTLLLERDGRVGEGGAGVRAVAADLPGVLLALHHPRSYLQNGLGTRKRHWRRPARRCAWNQTMRSTTSTSASTAVILNRLEEAEAVYQQAEERKLENDELPKSRYTLAFLKGDTGKDGADCFSRHGKAGPRRTIFWPRRQTRRPGTEG